jgi:hypothetical protein
MGWKFILAALAALTAQVWMPAHAGLVNGTNTVSAYFWFPSPTIPPGPCDPTRMLCENEDYNTPSGPTNTPAHLVPVDFLEGVLSGATASVSNNQIVITKRSIGGVLLGEQYALP